MLRSKRNERYPALPQFPRYGFAAGSDTYHVGTAAATCPCRYAPGFPPLLSMRYKRLGLLVSRHVPRLTLLSNVSTTSARAATLTNPAVRTAHTTHVAFMIGSAPLGLEL